MVIMHILPFPLPVCYFALYSKLPSWNKHAHETDREGTLIFLKSIQVMAGLH